MKTRKILFAAAALTVLAACNSDDAMTEPTEQRVPVTLAYTTIDAAETRAAQDLNEGTFASDENVKVRISNTGEDSWTDYTFTTAAAGAMTAPDPAPYYPAGSQNIDIVAYYPATAGETFTVADDQTADADYKASDLMFTSVTNQAKQANAVNLAFSHKMAKICVNVTAGQGVTSISDVYLLSVKPTVSFNQTTGEVGEATGYPISIHIGNNGAALIPPQTFNGGLLHITTPEGDVAIYSVDNKEFAAGQLYTLNITVNLRALNTTTAITGWTSEGTVTVNPVVKEDTSPVDAEAVNMGLSVKWANMNVGAREETDFGTYFAWGETSGYTVVGSTYEGAAGNVKNNFSYETYALCNGTQFTMLKYNKSTGYGNVDNKTELVRAHDAASANWGGTWRMPTKTEMEELLATKNQSGYTWTWCDGSTTKYKDSTVQGWKITYNSKGNTIFLPAAGHIKDDVTNGFFGGAYGYYWTSTVCSTYSNAMDLYFYSSDEISVSFTYRSSGLTVRPVKP